jgi:LAO/AO transport system kinase
MAIEPDDDALAAALLARQRRALAKAITLVESSRPDHRLRAQSLLDKLLPHTGKAYRIGISGVPGVGKSTFIEAFGMHLLAQGLRVAVLAVDPSSPLTGGSILGDKTRMERLSQQENAYIRPSPTRGALGGVGHQSREAMLMCEAAGFDVIIVETVGVGQAKPPSPACATSSCCCNCPTLAMNCKASKGILELADIVVYNKADIDPRAAAVAAGQMRAALHMLRPASPHWQMQVLQASASTGAGIEEVWAMLQNYRKAMQQAGAFEERRKHRPQAWMWQLVEAGLQERFRNHDAVRAALPQALQQAADGQTNPATLASLLLDAFRP